MNTDEAGDTGRRHREWVLQGGAAGHPAGSVTPDPHSCLVDSFTSQESSCVQTVRASGDADRRAEPLSHVTAGAFTREREHVGRPTMTEPARSSCTVLAALPSAVSRGREFTRLVLGAWRLPAMVDTVELIVSELLTNAVRATGVLDESVDESLLLGKVNPVYLCLTLTAESVLIQVWDVSAIPPLHRVASESDETGRGLLLVQMLSKEWNYDVLETGGKIVWCRCLIEQTA